MPGAKILVIPQNRSTPRQETTAGRCHKTGTTLQRWKTEHDMKIDVRIIVGILSTRVLFNKTSFGWHISGPQQSCSFLRYGPGLQGQHVGVWSATTADTSWQKLMTHFLQIFNIPPPPLSALKCLNLHPAVQRRPSFLFPDWDTPIISKDQVSAHLGLWCS